MFEWLAQFDWRILGLFAFAAVLYGATKWFYKETGKNFFVELYETLKALVGYKG